MFSRRDKIILSIVIGLIFLVAGIAIYFVLFHWQTCEFTTIEPSEPKDLADNQIVSWKDSQMTMLVRFIGHFSFAPKKYLAIELDSISFVGNFTSDKIWAGRMILEFNCSTIEIPVKTLNLNGDLSVSAEPMRVIVDQPNGRQSCLVKPKRSYFKTDGTLYNCKKYMNFDCQNPNDETINHLIVRRFEFEINGDPESFAKGRFSKDSETCDY